MLGVPKNDKEFMHTELSKIGLIMIDIEAFKGDRAIIKQTNRAITKGMPLVTNMDSIQEVIEAIIIICKNATTVGECQIRVISQIKREWKTGCQSLNLNESICLH